MLGHLRSAPSGPYLDGFAAALERQGYGAGTAVRYLRAAAHLGHVVARQGAMPSDIDLAVFSEHLRTCRCPRAMGARIFPAAYPARRAYACRTGGPRTPSRRRRHLNPWFSPDAYGAGKGERLRQPREGAPALPRPHALRPGRWSFPNLGLRFKLPQPAVSIIRAAPHIRDRRAAIRIAPGPWSLRAQKFRSADNKAGSTRPALLGSADAKSSTHSRPTSYSRRYARR